MADIFVSCKSNRRPAVAHFSSIVEAHGFSVWFDYALIKGQDFAKQLDHQIRSAKVVVVLWCGLSVNSEWVHEEVDLAKSLGILLPVKIESCELRLGTRRLDYVDLTSWDGDPRSNLLDELWRHIASRIGRPPTVNRETLMRLADRWKESGAPRLTSSLEGAPALPESKRSLPGNPNTELDPSYEITYWETIRDSAEPSDFEGFLLRFQNSTFRDLALTRLEAAEWKRLRVRDTLEGFYAYLQRYPSGRYREEALDLVKPQLAFEAGLLRHAAENQTMPLLAEGLERGNYKLLDRDIRELLRLYEEERSEAMSIRDGEDHRAFWIDARAKRWAFNDLLVSKLDSYLR